MISLPEEEQIIAIPDLYESEEKLQIIENTFTSYFMDRGFGWKNPSDLLRVVPRGPAELFPNPSGERIRQLVANVLVFELPDDIINEVRAHYGKAQNLDYVFLNQIVVTATLFATVRLKGSTEERLHGKLACGLGGHVDGADLEERWVSDAPMIRTLDRLVQFAAMREVQEELKSAQNDWQLGDLQTKQIQPLGVIISGASPVERVHIGMISVLAVPKSWNIEVRETEKLEEAILPLNSLRNTDMLSEHFELDNWTRLVFETPVSTLAHYIAQSIVSRKQS